MSRHIVVVAIATAVATVNAQTFDVVSIKRNTSDPTRGSNSLNERPNGGFTLLNTPITTLIARAYPSSMPIPVGQLAGLPAWAGITGEHYDIIAKSSLSRPATPDERQAMMRALLGDRFKLVTHIENREQQGYDLVFARGDHRLGPNIKPSEPSCEAKLDAERTAMEAARAEGKRPPLPPRPDRDGHTPPCWGWQIGPAEGDITLENLAANLRLLTLRPVTNKTGLTGSYRIKLTFDVSAGLRGPEIATNPDAPPTVFVAVQEQLGLKLVPVTSTKETLVIDHIERPTEN